MPVVAFLVFQLGAKLQVGFVLTRNQFLILREVIDGEVMPMCVITIYTTVVVTAENTTVSSVGAVPLGDDVGRV